MDTVKTVLKWCFMLTKRLYKKPAFILLLLMIPLIVGIYSIVAQEESGVMTIAVACEEGNDPFSEEVAKSFLDSSELILFVYVESENAATEMVRMQKADAAWIFSAELKNKLKAYISSEHLSEPLVRVVVRENTVSIMLANEKLSGTIFKHCARMYYLYCLQQNAQYLGALTEEEILAKFDSAEITDQLFAYYDIDGNQKKANEPSENYLLTPLRGLLGIIIVLCGMATALYYMEDEASGLFSWLSAGSKGAVEFGYQAISVGNISAAVLLSVLLAGLYQSVFNEIIVAVLFVLCCASYCQMLRAIFARIKTLAIFIPVLVVLMVALCPVFYDFAAFRFVQLLFPPTYYIHSAYNSAYIGYMLVFTLLCQMISWLIRKVKGT